MFRDGALVVEQYVGTANSQEIIDNDRKMLEAAPENQKLLLLSDISQVQFPDIPTEAIPSLFQPMEEFADKSHEMRVALYTGNNELTDFDKANKYAQEGSIRSMAIVPFNRLESAMNWLGVTEQEKEEIRKYLEG